MCPSSGRSRTHWAAKCRGHGMRRRELLAGLGIAICWPPTTRAQQPAFRVAQSGPPHLMDITPSSAPAGEAYPVRATIRGTGFAPAGNMVEFGPIKISDVAASGDRITFAVPKLVPSRSEVPPAVLTPGEYPVTVTTPLGRSNSLKFTLTSGGLP